MAIQDGFNAAKGQQQHSPPTFRKGERLKAEELNQLGAAIPKQRGPGSSMVKRTAPGGGGTTGGELDTLIVGYTRFFVAN